jgi:hypothetical protein
MIEPFKLPGCALKESNGIHLESESLANRAQFDPSVPLCDCPLLTEEPLADVFLHREAVIGVPKQLGKLLLDRGRNQLSEFLLTHLDHRAGHSQSPLIEDSHFATCFQTRAAWALNNRGHDARSFVEAMFRQGFFERGTRSMARLR